MKYQSFVATLSFMYLFMPLLVSAQCEGLCTFNEEEQNKHGALKLKLVAITSILASSVIGVCLPILGRTISAVRPEKDVFFVIKAFAAGVILATGFIHVLPDAFDNLSSPCLKVNPWGNFPFAGFIAMLSAIGTLMVDAFATIYYTRLKVDKAKLVSVGTGYEEKVGEELMTHVHVHGSGIVLEHNDSTGLIRHRIISQVLELGIVVHSIIIGISVGASQSSSTIKPLVAALSFHQFFEGMGLGGCICQAKFKVRAVTIMALFFSLTTPIGIALGIGISTVYNENSPSALIVEGIFNSASAGILIYMALVDLLAADFMSPKMQSSGKLQLWANSSLLIGAGLMSLLAKWA